ncbi:MAG: hypothetical protein ACI9GW_002462, partial [Halieaceae bacterium]
MAWVCFGLLHVVSLWRDAVDQFDWVTEIMKIFKKMSLVSLLIVPAAMWIFSGQAPDNVYRIFPGYFPDPHNWWSETPLDSSDSTQARLP